MGSNYEGERLEREERERKTRIYLSTKLRGTWDLMRICKDFIKEWGREWTEGSGKKIVREREEREDLEREKIFTKIAQKKELLEKKKMQSILNFKVGQWEN